MIYSLHLIRGTCSEKLHAIKSLAFITDILKMNNRLRILKLISCSSELARGAK